MKTIFQINTVVNWGSTGKIAEEIGQLAIQSGWDSYIAYGRNERPSKSKLIKIGNVFDIKLHGLQTRIFDRHGLGSTGATIKLIKQIEEIKPDVIHLHNLHGYYLNIEVLFKYLSTIDVPIVWTLHDCWPMTGHCAYFDYVGCNKWKTQCDLCPQKKEYPGSLFVDRSKKNYILKKESFTAVESMTLVPVSQWLNDIVKSSYLAKYPVQVINNGTDLNTFNHTINGEIRTKFGLNGYFILLGVASVWERRKGLEDFIQLSKVLSDDCKIVLVGLNKEQLQNLPPKICGIARTEDLKQLAELYSIADIFVNLTREDNFPTTNIEALACETPVLTYRTGGSIESITSKTGFIVEQGDIKGILNVVEMVRDKGKSYYSTACRERAVNYFNKDDRYQEYMNLYDEILDRKKL